MVKHIKAVIGANYGDEGKGLMTDYFAADAKIHGENCVVVCTNGGAQRGHTVVAPSGESHVFHHFGSGTFAGADTFLPEQFIVNPMIFMDEYKNLSIKPKVYIHPNCRVSTPFDMIANMVIEDSRGNNRYGSVGVGIWETIQRYKNFNSKTIQELSNMTNKELELYLYGVLIIYYVPYLHNCHNITFGKWSDICSNNMLIQNYIKDFRTMLDIVQLKYNGVLCNYDTVIFENGQGLLLDDSLNNPANNFYTTPSKTDMTYIQDILDDLSYCDINKVDCEACFVTRSYMTKHGAGAIQDEYIIKRYDNPQFIKLKTETNIPNAYQGSLKYGCIDWDNFVKRIQNTETYNFKKTIAVTHLDEYEVNLNYLNYYASYGRTRYDIKEKRII